MSEAEPNAKGPAKVQMSPEQMAHLGLSPSPGATPPEPTLIPADQVKPEDIATLSIEYRDGRPVVVASGGKYAPSELPVVNSSGAVYTARFAWSNGVAHLHTPDPVPASDGSPRRPASGPDVLLVLFDSVPDQIAIREPGEGIHFGPS
ncbi:hypothetical protein Slala03_54470 [Streptomyces lavendulae subsp. lavendulae]|uniref:hypothetical protein n=1 Tax=Streptomyces lavendulae TaxID=1914 RepID=UPI0024A53629|nr:hypothetical protein [Streptomyces lavendulae]GLV85758.1 hypothetical protein Slala03_54470 [Streptomyces lavendulae subsp. lavendulae]